MNIAAGVNEHMAQISNYLVYSAMAVYTLAFLAHITEWIFGSRSRVGRTARAVAAPAATASAPAVRVKQRGGGTAVLDRPKVVTRDASEDRGATDGPGAAGGSEKGDLYGRIAISLTTLAFLLHVGGVLARALSVGRAPWGNMYEFSVALGMVAVGVYLALLALGKNVRWVGLFLITSVLLDLGLAVTVLYADSDQLVPALHSYWLWIHVSCAIICGAVLHLGALATLLYLFRDGYEVRQAQGRLGKLDSMMERLPAAASLDKFAYRINAAIFPLWTFTIIAGSIWAESAWGRYWGWDPTETWSFITWVAYACYLHARATAGWKGRKAAYLCLIAFGCYLFNFYCVNIFIVGKHSYAGL
ncbi:c-type cytochrome biogenesis protein CcsB [Streptantibioticus ferralitis]|uniref:C-type cytochrome biogenesis protein CcsB n=1 Tax=Streptantibioticus ferralitis TaxID=236510 RepID=A0ABT5Z7T7_9ACTN|nr:c-type cytochrome biogenesis protein CcsB [Streptantibioticus ferralitis]MDF2259824.1 c-type cytochrome biogenesis protein CcsB [Streptantibioticus ferralitis]